MTGRQGAAAGLFICDVKTEHRLDCRYRVLFFPMMCQKPGDGVGKRAWAHVGLQGLERIEGGVVQRNRLLWSGPPVGLQELQAGEDAHLDLVDRPAFFGQSGSDARAQLPQFGSVRSARHGNGEPLVVELGNFADVGKRARQRGGDGGLDGQMTACRFEHA